MAEPTPATVLQVDHLTIISQAARRPLVDDVSLSLRKGECLGIVGESGSGKSLTLRSIIGLIPTTLEYSGRMRMPDTRTGELATYEPFAVRGHRVGMVFQDPTRSLNPLMTVRKSLREPLRQHLGMNKEQAEKRSLSLLEEVGIPDPVRVSGSYPHQLSGGLRQRVMIAAALAAEPDILLCDEPTTALDVTTQKRILDLLRHLRAQRGLSVIFVTHDLAVVSQITDRIIVLYAGQMMESGRVDEVLFHAAHPYTRGLLGSVPTQLKPGERFRAIPGRPLGPSEVPAGCVFAPRCPLATEDCRRGPVAVRELAGHHLARCLLAEQGRTTVKEPVA